MMLTLIMSYIMQQIFYFSIYNFPYVKHCTSRCIAWSDLLVKQGIKLELEMPGGFGKIEV